MKTLLNEIKKGSFLSFILAVIWIALLTFSYFGNIKVLDEKIRLLPLSEVRQHLDKELLNKRLIEMQGIVYVPNNIDTLSTSHQKDTPKNISTYNKQKSTLIDSAIVVRLVHGLEFTGAYVKGHIISLEPTHSRNKIDAWEEKALLLIQNGEKEFYSFQQENEIQLFRYMVPLVTQKPCLNCHSGQGYKVGEINSVISVAQPFTGYLPFADSLKKTVLIFHLIIVLLSVLGLYVITNSNEKHKRKIIDEKNKLQQSEERLKSFEVNISNYFSTIDDIVLIGSRRGNIYYANDAATRKLGYTNEELMQMHVSKLFSPSIQKEIEPILEEIDAGMRDTLPFPYTRKDGTLLPVESRVWYGKWDNQDCVFGISKSLSSEQESLQKFIKLFNNNPVLMAIIDLSQHKFTEVNNTFLKTLGYTKEEIIGKTTDEIDSFIDRETRKMLSKELRGKGQIHNIEIAIENRRGETIYGLYSGEIIESQGKQYFLTVMVDITELKHTQKSLERERQRLASILEGTQAGGWEWNVQTGEVIVSESWANILGYTRKEIEPMDFEKWKSFIHVDDLVLFGELLENHFSGKLPYFEYECRMEKKEGSWIWGDVRGRVFSWTDDGKPLLMLGSQYDITTRKITEEKLRESEARHRLLADNAMDVIWTMNMQFGFTYVSPSVEKLRGFTVEEVMKQTPQQVFSADSLRHMTNGLSEIYKGDSFSFYRDELEQLCKDGTTVWTDTTVSGMYKSSGEFIGMLGVSKDISKRKKIERQLRESEERIRLVIENSPLGIFFYDTNGKIEICNSAFSSILGTPKEILTGLELLKLPRTRLVECTGQTLKGEPAYFEEMYTAVTSLKSVFLRALFTPVFNSDKKIIGGIGMVEDITERKKNEEQIKKYSDKLETINAEKDKFFSIIAHDLRSPFQSFITLTEEIVSNINDYSLQELSEMMGAINAKANNLFMLLKNLLEWSQMQGGSYKFEPRNIDLYKLVIRNIDLIKPVAEKKGIILFNDIKKNVMAYADENMINSIVSNLITNAVKFTRKDGKITISSRVVENNVIEISVADTGIGMPEDILHNLFKIHEKVGRAGTSGEESSGLGLLLCKEFIERHNGKIWAESNIGKGSTFYFTLTAPMYNLE